VRRDLFPEDLKTLPRTRRRLAELLVKSGDNHPSQKRSFSLDFLLDPTSFQTSPYDHFSLSSVNFRKTQYTEESARFNPSAAVSAIPEEELINLPASVAFRSIGYKSEPLPGLADLNVPFEPHRGIIPNQLGRAVSQSNAGIDVTPPVPGIYVAGWVKRGPTGVIASTMEDAFATADSILHDLKSGQPLLNYEEGGSTGLGWEGICGEAERAGIRRTDWADWRRIDKVERERGAKLGKEREKISSVDEMLRVLDI
jgi:adrenodoxin-NADP+ reductase